MLRSLRLPRYPLQLWLLFWGTLLSSSGQSLVWPFLTINIREQLDIPLTTITLLFTAQSIAGFVATTVLGPMMDRIGRKGPMIGGLIASSAVLFLMSEAASLTAWAILLPAYGVVNAVFRIGSYAMVADMIDPQRRADVYALLRMGDNVGIAAGPAVGGFLVSVAYTLSYYLAAAVQIVLAILVALRLVETLPRQGASDGVETLATAPSTGYGKLLRDRPFLVLWGLYILVQIATSMVFVLLGVYVKENFGIPENRYGFIIGVNAGMVVLFQYPVTRWAARFRPLWTITLGALIYAVGMLGFGASRAFAGFLVSMVVMTLGEVLLVPTATALAANMAPETMRARYMGVFSLSFRVGAGIGPVVGGLLSDHIAPAATWYGGMLFCLVAAVGFALLGRRQQQARPHPTPEPGA
ncbi:MAG: MFS transporter [Chloroflexi bacterium]|nr:MFS transporter [Chloroflexota bacterium]